MLLERGRLFTQSSFGFDCRAEMNGAMGRAEPACCGFRGGPRRQGGVGGRADTGTLRAHADVPWPLIILTRGRICLVFWRRQQSQSRVACVAQCNLRQPWLAQALYHGALAEAQPMQLP